MKVQTLTHLLVVEKSHLDTPPKYIVTGHLPSRTQWTIHSKPTHQEYRWLGKLAMPAMSFGFLHFAHECGNSLGRLDVFVVASCYFMIKLFFSILFLKLILNTSFNHFRLRQALLKRLRKYKSYPTENSIGSLVRSKINFAQVQAGIKQ